MADHQRILFGLLAALLVFAVQDGGLPLPIVDPERPAPIKVEGFHVLMVEETAKRGELPPSQAMIFTAKAVRDFVREKGGDEALRVLDQNDDMSQDLPLWREAMALPRQSVPWIVISNGRTGYEGPLPPTIDETLTLLNRFAP